MKKRRIAWVLVAVMLCFAGCAGHQCEGVDICYRCGKIYYDDLKDYIIDHGSYSDGFYSVFYAMRKYTQKSDDNVLLGYDAEDRSLTVYLKKDTDDCIMLWYDSYGTWSYYFETADEKTWLTGNLYPALLHDSTELTYDYADSYIASNNNATFCKGYACILAQLAVAYANLVMADEGFSYTMENFGFYE